MRYGVVMLLFHFVDSGHIEADLQLLGAIHSEAYYVRMAVAWALSVCYIKFRQPTMALLGSGQLDDDTLNKALQKCIESVSVAPADKQQLRLDETLQTANLNSPPLLVFFVIYTYIC